MPEEQRGLGVLPEVLQHGVCIDQAAPVVPELQATGGGFSIKAHSRLMPGLGALQRVQELNGIARHGIRVACSGRPQAQLGMVTTQVQTETTTGPQPLEKTRASSPQAT